MSSAPVAVARVTTVCPFSQCMLVPLGCLFKGSTPVWRGPRATSEPVDGRVQAWTRLALDSFEGPPTQYGEGHGPPASRSTVGCKPGHDSPWDTITETSVKGSDAINPQGWEMGSLSETPHFLWLPFLVGIPAVQVTAAIQGIRKRTRVVRRLTGRARSTRFRLARFLRGSFLCGFCLGFRSCRGAGEGVLFPRQRRAQSLQEGFLLFGLFWDALNEEFSFRKEVRSWSRSC